MIPQTADQLSEAKELVRLDDPATLKRCIKLKWRRDFQNTLFVVGVFLLIAGLVFLQIGYLGSTSRHSYHSQEPKPAYIPYGFGALGIAVACFACTLLCQNYCLIDPQERRVYRVFRLLLWKKRQVVFRAEQILGVTTDCKRETSRYGVRWYYRAVAIGRNGHKEPLGNWRRNGLHECNCQARDLAAKLNCASQDGQSESTVSMKEMNGAPTLEFTSRGVAQMSPLRWIGIIVVVAVYILIKWCARR